MPLFALHRYGLDDTAENAVAGQSPDLIPLQFPQSRAENGEKGKKVWLDKAGESVGMWPKLSGSNPTPSIRLIVCFTLDESFLVLFEFGFFNFPVFFALRPFVVTKHNARCLLAVRARLLLRYGAVLTCDELDRP
jgi:hypothetical protein